MTVMELLASQPWVERLGWTLVHFLWQGALIGLVYAAARALARPARPNVRYLLACTALGTMLAAPVVTWSLLRVPGAALAAVSTPVSAPVSGAGPKAYQAPLPTLFIAAGFRVPAQSWTPWVVAVWLAGTLAFCLRLAGGWAAATRLRSTLVGVPSDEWQQAFDRLKTRLRLSQPVRLLISALAESPMVVGWLHPVVLLPTAALTGLEPAQIEMLLLHELEHIRRGDYLVNILQSIAEALLFYHPAVWWVSGHIRAERELCCDDRAVSLTGDFLTYARALAAIERLRVAPVAVAANGGSLVHRIARLLGQPRPAQRAYSAPGAAAVVLLVTAGLAIFAQSAARPQFEVASIKPSQEMSFMAIRALPGGRLNVNAPLRLMIQNAYRLQSFQIMDGPGWIDSERYTIEAKAADDPDRSQMMDMLRSLLEDRFQLKAHRETRQLPVYNVIAAKGGIKHPPSSGPCIEFPMNGPPPPPAGRGAQAPVPCGHLMITGLGGGVAQMLGDAVPMTELTRILAVVLGRTAIDDTGYTGTINVKVRFTVDTTTAGLPFSPAPMQPAGAAPPAEPGAPSIFTALQQELGLKLESAKGPVEVLIIDHVEKPSAN
jgi:uncharacterized protein (TIGR03435 family)